MGVPPPAWVVNRMAEWRSARGKVSQRRSSLVYGPLLVRLRRGAGHTPTATGEVPDPKTDRVEHGQRPRYTVAGWRGLTLALAARPTTSRNTDVSR